MVACSRALEKIGFNGTDLIELVDMENVRNRNAPFESQRLAQYFRRAVSGGLTPEERRNLDKFVRTWKI